MEIIIIKKLAINILEYVINFVSSLITIFRKDFDDKMKIKSFKSGVRWGICIGVILPVIFFIVIGLFTYNHFEYTKNLESELRNTSQNYQKLSSISNTEYELKNTLQEYWSRVIREKDFISVNSGTQGKNSSDLIYKCVKKQDTDDRCNITKNEQSKNLTKYNVEYVKIIDITGNLVKTSYMSSATYIDTGSVRNEKIFGFVDFEIDDNQYLILNLTQRVPCRLETDEPSLKKANTDYTKIIFNCGYLNNDNPYKISF